MVNLHSPVLSEQVGLAYIRLWHVLAGIYLWEFFTTLDYEWRVIRGHLHRRWTIWVYSLSRVACLVAVILNTAGLDTATRLDCQLWISSMGILFCLSMAAATLLIVLRIIAIWNRNKAITATAITIWGIGVAFHINAAARLRSKWDPLLFNCLSVTTERGLLGLIPTIFADLTLVLIMLVGLLLVRRGGGGMFGLTPILWRQAIIWLLLALVSETPPAVIATMSTNDQFINILLSPGQIIMTVAATRMHRSLVDYASGFPDVVTAQGNIKLQTSNPTFSETRRAKPTLDPPNRIQVTVHTAIEDHTTTQTNDQDSYNATDAQVHEKPNAWGIDDGAERGI